MPKEARRGTHRKARPRRPLPGMLLHTDVSTHAWTPGLAGTQDLIVVLDDATSTVSDARFVPQERTRTMLAALKSRYHAHPRTPPPGPGTNGTAVGDVTGAAAAGAAAGEGTAFAYTGDQLDRICAAQHARVVGNDNCVAFERRQLQIPQTAWRYSFAKCRVTVYAHLDGTLSLGYGPHTLGRYAADGTLPVPVPVGTSNGHWHAVTDLHLQKTRYATIGW